MNERERIIEKFREEAKKKGYSEEEIEYFIKKKIEIQRSNMKTKLKIRWFYIFFLLMTLIIFLGVFIYNFSKDERFNSRIHELVNYQVYASESNRIIKLNIEEDLSNILTNKKNLSLLYSEIVRIYEILENHPESKRFENSTFCNLDIEKSEIYILGFIKNKFFCIKLTNFTDEDHCQYFNQKKEIFKKMLINNNYLIKIFCNKDSLINENLFLDSIKKGILY